MSNDCSGNMLMRRILVIVKMKGLIRNMIPKIIHLCWISREEYPELIKKCLSSWKEVLPDYEIRIWNAETFDMNTCEWTRQAFERKRYASISDYIRYYALYNYGGIYLDSDVEVIKAFDDLLGKKYFIGFEYTGMPEAAVIGAVKGLEWIKICKEWYEDKSYINYSEKKKNIIAPLIMLYGFEKDKHIKLIDNQKIRDIDGGTVYSYEFFSPKNGFTGDILKTDKTFAIHHFSSAWITDKLSVKSKIKRDIHKFIINVIGKKNYNYLLYFIRNNLHKV